VRRFGDGLLDALDQAFGEKPELYPWLTLPEAFDEPLELPAHVENASALLFGARRLLALLHAWLQARQQGALVLRLGWQMDRRRNGPTDDHLLVRTAEPTLDMAHFERLLAEHLARTSRWPRPPSRCAWPRWRPRRCPAPAPACCWKTAARATACTSSSSA
jgi:protein ImuB